MTNSVQLDLWFHQSQVEIAEDLADVLRAAGITPCLRPYASGQAINNATPDGIVPILTASDIHETWIDEHWIQFVYQKAVSSGVPVFCVRAGACTIPESLSKLSFADLLLRGPDREFPRLLTSMAAVFGTDRIRVPTQSDEAPTQPPQVPMLIRFGGGFDHILSAD